MEVLPTGDYDAPVSGLGRIVQYQTTNHFVSGPPIHQIYDGMYTRGHLNIFWGDRDVWRSMHRNGGLKICFVLFCFCESKVYGTEYFQHFEGL